MESYQSRHLGARHCLSQPACRRNHKAVADLWLGSTGPSVSEGEMSPKARHDRKEGTLAGRKCDLPLKHFPQTGQLFLAEELSFP
jgi:hypothetical protein